MTSFVIKLFQNHFIKGKVMSQLGSLQNCLVIIKLLHRSKKCFFKWANFFSSFCSFSSFQHKFYRKNCRHQQDSNSNWQSRRRARWPLDHHHLGPRRSKKCLSPTFSFRERQFPISWVGRSRLFYVPCQISSDNFCNG